MESSPSGDGKEDVVVVSLAEDSGRGSGGGSGGLGGGAGSSTRGGVVAAGVSGKGSKGKGGRKRKGGRSGGSGRSGDAAAENALGDVLKRCMEHGSALLLEDAGTVLPSVLGPVLARPASSVGAAGGSGRVVLGLAAALAGGAAADDGGESMGPATIRVGETDVLISGNFRLYITTRHSNPHLLPEMSTTVNVIDFGVTVSGLEEQLLAITVEHERPEVEKRRGEVLERLASDSRERQQLEDTVLKQISEAGDDILDDEVLIDSLSQAKTVSKYIRDRLLDSKQIQHDIGEARDRYRVVARRGSLLFFCASDMATVDPMYQVSLPSFVTLFGRALKDPLVPFFGGGAAKAAERCSALQKAVTEAVFFNICRGLFERDKILLALAASLRLLLDSKRARGEQTALLLRGGAVVDRS